jgi:hypothetical protein
MRSYAVCPDCCGVHATGAQCPTCAGIPDPLDFDRSELHVAPARRRPGRAAIYAIGVGIGLAAFTIIVVFGS